MAGHLADHDLFDEMKTNEDGVNSVKGRPPRLEGGEKKPPGVFFGSNGKGIGAWLDSWLMPWKRMTGISQSPVIAD